MNEWWQNMKMQAIVLRRAGWLATLALAMAVPAGGAQASTTLVRITPEEYSRTIRHVFGPAIKVADNKVQPGFRDEGLLAVGERRLTITSAELERYERLGLDIARQVMAPTRRDILVQCRPHSEQAPDDACASEFLARAGRLLLRRPLTQDELTGFVQVQHRTATELRSFNQGLALALSRLLVDPEFLFRVERTLPPDGEGSKAQLDAYSRASRLSFFLWDAAPDGRLLEAAQSGRLMTERGLVEQVDRMLKSPRLEDGVRAFFTDMLGFDGFATLNVDTSLFPRFTKNVEEDAREQTLRTIVDHLLNRNARYSDLFTTPHTFLTPSLAALYQVALPRAQELGGAVPWVPYTFQDEHPHVGILSQVSFLSLHSHPARSSPTLRGKALREIFLCQRVPPPPGEVDFNLVQDTSNPEFKTVRQRLTAHSSEAMCAGCHKITDPMGLALENFTTGADFRTHENGADIDTSGTLNGKDFNGLKELTQVLSNDPAVNACVVRRVYAYGAARQPDAGERKWLTGLQKQVSAESLTWRELMRQVALAPEFFSVPVAPTEPALSAQARP